MEYISILLHVKDAKCSCKKYDKSFFLNNWTAFLMTDKTKGKVYFMDYAVNCLHTFYFFKNRI